MKKPKWSYWRELHTILLICLVFLLLADLTQLYILRYVGYTLAGLLCILFPAPPERLVQQQGIRKARNFIRLAGVLIILLGWSVRMNGYYPFDAFFS